MMNGNDDDISEILYFHPFRDSSVVNALYEGESAHTNGNSQIIKITFLIKWIFCGSAWLWLVSLAFQLSLDLKPWRYKQGMING